LGQVKATQARDPDNLPARILGAAWRPQEERMNAGIYFPLFLVARAMNRNKAAVVYYLSADLQHPSMFVPRKPLSASARRAGWRGFYYDLSEVRDRVIRLHSIADAVRPVRAAAKAMSR